MSSPADPLYSALLVLDRDLLRQVKSAWYALELRDLQVSFAQDFVPRVLPLVVSAQTAAAELGARSIASQVAGQTVVYRPAGQSDLLPAVQVHPLPAPEVNAAGFAGAASDGRPLPSLLAQPLIEVYQDLGNGVPPGQALQSGFDSMDRILTTQVQDAARSAESVAMVVHRVTYYIRVVEPGACGRCLILDGVHYKVNAGFLRHPSCRCHHRPGVAVYEDPADGSRLPRAARPADRGPSLREIFDRMPVEQQNRTFTVAGAQAIRDGADIPQVVNSRRSGMSTVFDRYGTRFRVTTAGAGRRRHPRLLPEAIYKLAGGDHAEVVRLLRANGYIR